MNYEVTIGIPVYRAADYIAKTMESALSQSFASIEFLVVDDFGNDGSMAVVEKLQREHPRGKDIRILYNKQNEGVGVSRNCIMDNASGKYLYYLDSDDQIEPYTIQLLFDKIQEFQADVVYGSLDRIDLINHSSVQSMVLPDLFLQSEGDLAYYAFKNYQSFQISVCNCLINMDFLRNCMVRFIDAVYWEDMVFTYEIVTKVRKAVLLSNVTYHYLCRPGSLSHYQDRTRLEKKEIQVNIHAIDVLKERSMNLTNKRYLPYLCRNLEMNSFFVICYILKYNSRIFPSFTRKEIRNILHHPMPIFIILRFRNLLFTNAIIWLIWRMPVVVFFPIIKLLRKIYNIKIYKIMKC